MEISLTKNAGFCAGVRRADSKIRSLIANKAKDEQIFTLGTLIHNSDYTNELKSLGVGVCSLDDVESIISNSPLSKITFVIRTHGIRKEEEARLRLFEIGNPNIKIVDLTCPSVKKIHKIAEENTNENTEEDN